MTPRKLILLVAVAQIALASPAFAQMNHSGMNMSNPPAKPRAKQVVQKKKKKAASKVRPASARAGPKKRATAPARARTGSTPHAGHDMSSMAGGKAQAGTPQAGHDMSQMPGMAGQQPSSMPGHDMSQMPGMEGQQPSSMRGHDMSQMPGMEGQQPSSMPGHDMSQMPGMEGQQPTAMAGHDMAGMASPTGTNLPAGNAAPPPVPRADAADLFYPGPDMGHAREHGQQMHGGENFYQVMFNIAEYQVRNGRDGYNWDAEAWYGGDINRLWLKSEGEGEFRRGVERAEIQALYSRAIGPYFNLQGGLRYDFKPNPSRTYATIGVEGLAPSFFEVEGFLFLSNKGDLLARAGGSYDQRITQRLILQPRAEVNFAAQDVPADKIGAGVSDMELGLRLRYDIRREFAPYVGVEYQRAFGQTADFRRLAGEKPAGWNLVMGVRAWF